MSPASQSDGETLVALIHDHWIKYVMPVIVYILLGVASFALFLFAGWTAHHYIGLTDVIYLVALFLLLMAHHWFFAMLLSEANECIIVTDKRVIHMKTLLFFYEDMNEIAFDKMKTVEARMEGVLQNVLRYGTLVFEKGFEVRRVPHPTRVARHIEQAMGRK